MDKAQIDLIGARILLVDDTPENLRLLRQALEPEGYLILVASSGEAALKITSRVRPDLILLDVQMPGLDGFETCRCLKENPATQDIPVIFVTARVETESVVEGFRVGGVDYVVKPFQSEEVLARVHAHLRIDRLTRELVEKNAELIRTNQQLQEEIARRKDEQQQRLEVQQQLMQEMEKELQTAHKMQMGLMPKESPKVEGFDIAGRCVPANHVGGDYFQYFSQDGRLTLVLADVTSHAMEAAIPVVMFSGILESHMELVEGIERLFGRLNRSLHRVLTGRTFICFVLGEFDLSTRGLRLSNGACPCPYHFRAESGEVIELQVDAYPLGVRPDTIYPVIETQLHPGDRVVFCSDGIMEAVNAAGEQFGYERTAEMIRGACEGGLSAEATIGRILREVNAFRGDAPQADDMTCVVLRVEAYR